MKNRNLKPDDNWATPKHVYDVLNIEFNFDFDPCPYFEGNILPQQDGLLIDWGKMNFVNPPYSRKIKEAFVIKAINEMHKGNSSVLLLPVSTSTALFHDRIKVFADEIRFFKGRIKFQKKDPQSREFYTPKNGGMHDSMLVVFKGKQQ